MTMRNPYSTVLLVLALAGLISGGVFVAIGLAPINSLADSSQGFLAVIGSVALSAGGFFLILWITVSAITWSISHSSGR